MSERESRARRSDLYMGRLMQMLRIVGGLLLRDLVEGNPVEIVVNAKRKTFSRTVNPRRNWICTLLPPGAPSKIIWR